MAIVRNLFTALGIVAIVTLGAYIINPDIAKKFMPQVDAKPSLPPGKVTVLFRQEKGLLEIEKENPKNIPGVTTTDLMSGALYEGLPSKTTPYLLLVDINQKKLRYCVLKSNVTKISLKDGTSLDAKIVEMKPEQEQNKNGIAKPYQVEIWVSRSSDLRLEFELGGGTPSLTTPTAMPK